MSDQEQTAEEQIERIEHYNPVTVTLSESTGIIAIAVIAILLLIALLRAQGRIRELQEQQSPQLEE